PPYYPIRRCSTFNGRGNVAKRNYNAPFVARKNIQIKSYHTITQHCTDSERERENFNHALSSDPSSYFNPLLPHENSHLYRADFEIDVSYRWVYRSRRSHDAPSLNRHRPGRNPRTFLFVLIRRVASQVRLRAGSQGDAGESRRRVEGRQGEGPRDVQQGRGRLQGPRPLRL